MIHVIPEQNAVNCDNASKVSPLSSPNLQLNHIESLSYNGIWVTQNIDLERKCNPLHLMTVLINVKGKNWHTC